MNDNGELTLYFETKLSKLIFSLRRLKFLERSGMRWKLCQWTEKKEKWLLFVDAICPQPTSWMMMNDIKDYWYSVSINYKICGNVEILDCSVILKVLYSNAWNIINYTVDKQLNALQTRIQNVYIIIVSFTIYKFYCNVIKCAMSLNGYSRNYANY